MNKQDFIKTLNENIEEEKMNMGYKGCEDRLRSMPCWILRPFSAGFQ